MEENLPPPCATPSHFQSPRIFFPSHLLPSCIVAGAPCFALSRIRSSHLPSSLSPFLYHCFLGPQSVTMYVKPFTACRSHLIDVRGLLLDGEGLSNFSWCCNTGLEHMHPPAYAPGHPRHPVRRMPSVPHE